MQFKLKKSKMRNLVVAFLIATSWQFGCADETMQVIETENLTISLPQSVRLWCGYRVSIPISVNNKTSQTITTALQAKTEVNIFIDGLTCEAQRTDEPIEIGLLVIPEGKSQFKTLEIQSLRVGLYTLQIIINGTTIDLEIISELKEKGAYFMYRCWNESAEFFDTIFSDGVDEITQDQRRDKVRYYVRDQQSSGLDRDQVIWEASRQVWEKYKSVEYRKRSNWEKVYSRKKNQQTEKYGFQYIDIEGLGWSVVDRQRGTYQWGIGDFMLDLSKRYFYGEPFVRIESFPEWSKYVRGPSSKYGFYDHQNDVLLDSWEAYCEAIAERYDGDGIDDAPGSPVARHFILTNEPTQFWFSVNFDREGRPLPTNKEGIIPTRWYQRAAQHGGLEEIGRVYVDLFGDILYVMTKRAAVAIHRANPHARVATPQFITFPENLFLFKHMLDKGIGDYIDAWGIHPANYDKLESLWKSKPQGISYTVTDAANQAPPFDGNDLSKTLGDLDRRGQYLETVQPVNEIRRRYPYMGKLWRELIDHPYSDQLENINELFAQYSLSFPFWVTEEIMIGPLATNRRENLIAALREYAIVFNQNVEITTMASVIHEGIIPGHPLSHLPDPIARQLIVDIGKAIGGSQSVHKLDCQLFAPGDDNHLDYRWIVYKFFNRGNEDIMALWNNSGKEETTTFNFNPDVELSNIRLIEFDADEETFKQESILTEFPKEIRIKPLKEFLYISVESDHPSFGWLDGIQRVITPEEKELIDLLNKTKTDVDVAKSNLRRQRQAVDMRELRFIPETLIQAEDDIIMGNYPQARERLESIQQTLSRLN